MEIEERRKKVKELYNDGEGKTAVEIAKILNVSVSTVNRDIKLLKEKGEIVSLTIEERRKKVKELYNDEEGKTVVEIAKILHVCTSTVYEDIKFLREKGEIVEKTKSIIIEERRKKVKELYNEEKKSAKEIAEILNVSINKVFRDIKFLREKGEIVEHNKKRKTKNFVNPVIQKRRKKVKELYNDGEGKTAVEIAKILHVCANTVYKDIKFLKEKGEIVEHNKKRKTKNSVNPIIQKRREKVKELYNKEGKTVVEISEILNVSVPTVYSDIKVLKHRGEIIEPDKKRKNPATEERRKKVKELYNNGKGKTQKEISKILNVPIHTVYSDIKILRGRGEIVYSDIKVLRDRGEIIVPNGEGQTKNNIIDERRKNIQKIYNKDKYKKSDYELLESYIKSYKKEFEEKKLNKEELPYIKKIIDITDKYSHIIFYLRACVHLKQFQEAKKVVNSNLYNETFSKEQRDGIKELKNQIYELNRKYIAFKSLERGEGVKKAIECSGLPETEVVKLNNKMMQKKKENEEKIKEEGVVL